MKGKMMKIQNTAEAKAAIEWARKEIASDPDGDSESDMEELQSAYAAIFGESFPIDEEREEDTEPRGYAMWSCIRSALDL